MRAKSIKGGSTEEIALQLKNALSDGYQPTLAIVFISIKQDRKAICTLLHHYDIDVLGATSSGEFIQGHQSEGEATLMLLDLSRSEYQILTEDIRIKDAQDASTHMAKKAQQTFKNPAFILLSTLLSADGRVLPGEEIIESFENVLGSGVKIFGGMAGDDISFTGTYVFTKDFETDYGMIALVLNQDKISLQGTAISGWKPIGTSKKITHSKGNLVYTIDGKPALEMYLRYLGEDQSSAEDQIEFFNAIGLHYPIQIERAGRDPKMCGAIGYDPEEKALVFESEVTNGAMFKFSTPPDFDIVETVVNSAVDLKKDSGDEADALLIFSCAGRLSTLGPLAQNENEGLAEVWNAPMAGFYSYGEFGKSLSGRHEFHSTTCSWVALKEK